MPTELQRLCKYGSSKKLFKKQEKPLISVVVPAHNEEDWISMCLESLSTAAKHPGLNGEHVEIIVVLDACTDATKLLAEGMGATTLDIDARNVGTARQLGAQAALNAGARWLAFTDADTCVAPDWLVAQLALKADAVCGTIAVDYWGTYGERMRRHFSLTYNDRDGHSHVHGANLGVSAEAFAAVGGFQHLASGEDVALVQALSKAGAHIAWSRAPRVTTSARSTFRAPGGFGATLARIEIQGQWAGAASTATP